MDSLYKDIILSIHKDGGCITPMVSSKHCVYCKVNMPRISKACIRGSKEKVVDNMLKEMSNEELLELLL